MKNIVMMIISTILGVLTLMVSMTVSGRMNRNMEVKSSLPSAVEETVAMLAEHEKYTINDTGEYLSDMAANLAMIMDTDSGLEVEVLKADKEKGMLSIRVTEQFTHPNGEPGETVCERAACLNRLDEPEPAEYLIRYYLSKEDISADNCYKAYRALEGDAFPVPEEPTAEGKTFAGWKDMGDAAANFSQPIAGDALYYAVWN